MYLHKVITMCNLCVCRTCSDVCLFIPVSDHGLPSLSPQEGPCSEPRSGHALLWLSLPSPPWAHTLLWYHVWTLRLQISYPNIPWPTSKACLGPLPRLPSPRQSMGWLCWPPGWLRAAVWSGGQSVDVQAPHGGAEVATVGGRYHPSPHFLAQISEDLSISRFGPYLLCHVKVYFSK